MNTKKQKEFHIYSTDVISEFIAILFFAVDWK